MYSRFEAGMDQGGAQSRQVEPTPFENNYFTEMCCGSEAGSYLRLIDCCRTNMANTRQSRPNSGLGFQIKVLDFFRLFPLGSAPVPELVLSPDSVISTRGAEIRQRVVEG